VRLFQPTPQPVFNEPFIWFIVVVVVKGQSYDNSITDPGQGGKADQNHAMEVIRHESNHLTILTAVYLSPMNRFRPLPPNAGITLSPSPHQDPRGPRYNLRHLIRTSHILQTPLPPRMLNNITALPQTGPPALRPKPSKAKVTPAFRWRRGCSGSQSYP
jgi:hypothetical protein